MKRAKSEKYCAAEFVSVSEEGGREREEGKGEVEECKGCRVSE